MSPKLRQLMVLLVNPQADLEYISWYFRLVEVVHSWEGKPLLRKIHFINGLMSLQLFYLLCLTFFPPKTALEHAIFFDVFFILVPKSLYNLLVSLVVLMTMYFHYHIFARPCLPLMRQLRLVLLEDDTSWFLQSKYKDNKCILTIVKRCFLINLNCFHNFLLTVNLLAIYAHSHYLLVLYEHWDQLMPSDEHNILTTFVILLFHLSRGPFYWLCFYSYSHQLSICFSTSLTLIIMVYIKIKQSFTVLGQLSRQCRKFTTKSYTFFRTSYFDALTFFLQTNRAYGHLYLACFLAHCPVNIIINIWLFNGQVTNSFFVIVFNVHEFLFLFGIHLMLSRCTMHIHQVRDWFHLATLRQPDLYTQIKVSNDIAVINSKNRCGFTYGSFGLISLSAFVKYLIIYSKLLFISQKLMKNKQI